MQKIQVAELGRERRRVIVIDGFLPDPEAVVEAAAGHSYVRGSSAYPGVQAALPTALTRRIWAAAAPLVRQVFGLGPELTAMASFYSLITTPPAELQPVQRLPHFDGFGPFRVAVVHHLSRLARSGTAFYRHRSTGFETIDAGRLPVYNERVNAELNRHGLPSGYIGSDTPLYERIGRFEACFNRALIYLGHALHSAEVPHDLTLTDDPRTGRFSINTLAWGGAAQS